MKKSLKSSEWLLVGSLLFVMASLALIAKVNSYRASSTLTPHDLKQEEILVTVTGAVLKPGEYSVLSGTTIGEVLRKARPKAFANLQIIPLKKVVEEPLSINVEELVEITVNVRGEVEHPMEITLPAKSRVCDLKSKVSLTSGADKRFFRRRRMLKNGEVIEVPKKTVEVNSAN